MDSVKRQLNFATKQNIRINSWPIQKEKSFGPMVFGAQNLWREYDGIHRKSFLIDEEGKILHIFHKVKTKTHGQDVLKILQLGS